MQTGTDTHLDEFRDKSLIAALKYAARKADVILLPRVLPVDDNLDLAIKEVASRVPVVCASGNDGIAELAYPARLQETIAVGACNNRGYRSTYSQYGKVPDPDGGVDVVAPSNDIPVEDRELVRLDLEEAKDRTVKIGSAVPPSKPSVLTTTKGNAAYSENELSAEVL